MQCKNCKHWDRENIVPEGKETWGVNVGGMADCLNKKLDKSEDAKIISLYDAPTEQIADLESKVADLEKQIFNHITYGQ